MNSKRALARGLTLLGRLLQWLPATLCVNALAAGAWLLASGRSPKDGLYLLLQLSNRLYEFTNRLACDYGEGVHPKHRLLDYHDFFVKRLHPGEKVIDIGCGNGALAHDMAQRAKVQVTGIELNENQVCQAWKLFSHPEVHYIHGDALHDLPDCAFDVVVLSNVLEHIDDRVCFLQKISQRLSPARFLIRVPLYEREWRVPLMEELGIDYRLDKTHFIEYRPEIFLSELAQAGLQPSHWEVRWGEIWTEVRPAGRVGRGQDRENACATEGTLLPGYPEVGEHYAFVPGINRGQLSPGSAGVSPALPGTVRARCPRSQVLPAKICRKESTSVGVGTNA